MGPESNTTTQTKKKNKNNAIASKIIKKEVNSDLYINIIRKNVPYSSWKTLQ